MDRTHNPEFTVMELYVAYKDYNWMMDFTEEMIEKDPEWTVYGVGIIQQNNVIRAMYELGVIDDYVDAGYGFDHVKIFAPHGEQVARIPIHPLVEGYPANMGIARPALQKVLAENAEKQGAKIRLGLTADIIKTM